MNGVFSPSSSVSAGLYALLVGNHRERRTIEAFRNRQLRCLLQHAYDNVAHYRRLFDRVGLKPCDIRTIRDLPAIPTTSKKDLQQLLPHEVVARGCDSGRLMIHRTSGSTGEPFTF